MPTNHRTPTIPLPKGWKHHVQAAVLHVISLAQYTTIYARSWATASIDSRLPLKAQLDRANQEIALLRVHSGRLHPLTKSQHGKKLEI